MNKKSRGSKEGSDGKEDKDKDEEREKSWLEKSEKDKEEEEVGRGTTGGQSVSIKGKSPC